MKFTTLRICHLRICQLYSNSNYKHAAFNLGTAFDTGKVVESNLKHEGKTRKFSNRRAGLYSLYGCYKSWNIACFSMTRYLRISQTRIPQFVYSNWQGEVSFYRKSSGIGISILNSLFFFSLQCICQVLSVFQTDQLTML